MGENRQGGNDRNNPSDISQGQQPDRQDQQRQGQVDRQQNQQGSQQDRNDPQRRDKADQGSDQTNVERDRQR